MLVYPISNGMNCFLCGLKNVMTSSKKHVRWNQLQMNFLLRVSLDLKIACLCLKFCFLFNLLGFIASEKSNRNLAGDRQVYPHRHRQTLICKIVCSKIFEKKKVVVKFKFNSLVISTITWLFSCSSNGSIHCRFTTWNKSTNTFEIQQCELFHCQSLPKII